MYSLVDESISEIYRPPQPLVFHAEHMAVWGTSTARVHVLVRSEHVLKHGGWWGLLGLHNHKRVPGYSLVVELCGVVY